jgi:hypothetical protein
MITPKDDDLIGRISELERKVAELGRQTLENVIIPRGGIRLKGGGELAAEMPNGISMFYLGELTVGAVAFRGIIMRRQDGTPMFYTSIPGSDPTKIFFAWLDRSGNVLVSDDATAGTGLARPYIATPAARAKYTSWESTTSATYESLWHVRHIKQHPKVRGRIYATTDVAGTTGDWQIIVADTGEVLATGSVTFSQGAQQWGPVTLVGTLYADITLTIQARRTAGTGAVRIEHQFTAGVQS